MPTSRGAGVLSVTVMLALPVVRENLDDPAVGNPAVVAGDHGLELVAQGSEAGDLVVHPRECAFAISCALTAAAVGILCHVKQLTNGFDFEAEFARMSDKAQAPDRLRSIGTSVVVASIRLGSRRCSRRTGSWNFHPVSLDTAPIGNGFIKIPLDPLATGACSVRTTEFKAYSHDRHTAPGAPAIALMAWTWPSCAVTIETAIARVPGVSNIAVNTSTETLRLQAHGENTPAQVEKIRAGPRLWDHLP